MHVSVARRAQPHDAQRIAVIGMVPVQPHPLAAGPAPFAPVLPRQQTDLDGPVRQVPHGLFELAVGVAAIGDEPLAPLAVLAPGLGPGVDQVPPPPRAHVRRPARPALSPVAIATVLGGRERRQRLDPPAPAASFDGLPGHGGTPRPRATHPLHKGWRGPLACPFRRDSEAAGKRKCLWRNGIKILRFPRICSEGGSGFYHFVRRAEVLARRPTGGDQTCMAPEAPVGCAGRCASVTMRQTVPQRSAQQTTTPSKIRCVSSMEAKSRTL